MILFAVPLNLGFIINLVDVYLYGGKMETSYFVLKCLIFVGSFGGILAFTLLGRIDYCKCAPLYCAVMHSRCDHTGEVPSAHFRSNLLLLC